MTAVTAIASLQVTIGRLRTLDQERMWVDLAVHRSRTGRPHVPFYHEYASTVTRYLGLHRCKQGWGPIHVSKTKQETAQRAEQPQQPRTNSHYSHGGPQLILSRPYAQRRIPCCPHGIQSSVHNGPKFPFQLSKLCTATAFLSAAAATPAWLERSRGSRKSQVKDKGWSARVLPCDS